MKHIVILIIVFCSYKASGQTIPEQVAGSIANKMKDSLSLTVAQRDSLYIINLQLHAFKMNMRGQYSNSDTLRKKIQGIEKMRDSLYRPVMTEEQFQIYQLKKVALIRSN